MAKASTQRYPSSSSAGALVLAVRLLAATATLASAGCPASGEDVRPPDDQWFFPAGLDISDDDRFMFVTNSNSELRYDSGTVVVVDLAVVSDMVDEWLTTGVPLADTPDCEDCCEVDGAYTYTMVCNESRAILADATVRTGSFATEIDTQTLEDGRERLFVPVRADPSITWIDFTPDAPMLDCGGSGVYPACDEDHRMTQMRNDLDLDVIPSEPFGIFVDSGNGYAVVSHLSTGTVSLVDAPTDGSAPMVADAIGGLFAVNPNTLARGATGVAGRQPGSPSDLVYVTSRAESRVQMLHVYRPDQADAFPTLVPSNYFFLDRVLPSDNSRGIAFSDDGNRAHVVNRDPPMLLTVDTSLGADGFPRNQLLSAVEICPQAALVAMADVGRGERAFVSCFRDAQVWVVDPVSSVVESIVSVGSGPHALGVAPSRQLLLVANFLEDTVSVIDLAPGSATENRVVLRLGRPRQEGGK